MLAKYVIADPIGLHARPLSILVQEVSKYDVPMFLHYQEKRVPMHSLMMLMSLGVPHQGEIAIEIDSEDASSIHEALKAVMLKEGLIKPT